MKYVIVLVTGISIIICTLALTFDAACENTVYIVLESREERTSAETEESVKSAKFDVVEASHEYIAGFPCGLPDGMTMYTREEETESEETETEETLPSVEEVTERTRVVYSVCGVDCDPDYTDYLLLKLREYGIEWMMDICVAQMFQESRFDTYCENTNGQDKGILQFRLRYYKGTDIFNPYEQMDFYTDNLARRLSAGRDEYTVISDHYTGEYGYSSTYVQDVYQWVSQIKKREETK